MIGQPNDRWKRFPASPSPFPQVMNYFSLFIYETRAMQANTSQESQSISLIRSNQIRYDNCFRRVLN